MGHEPAGLARSGAAAPDTLDADRLVRFALPARHARGRLVRLGPTLGTILDAHAYPPPLARLLAQALALTALLGAVLREDEGQLTLQVQAKGAVVDLIVCHWTGGELRGYLRHDAVRLGRLGRNPSLKALLGQGYLAITLDQTASAERYQGIVPLEGGSLAEIAQQYFAQSEQLPTLIRLAAEGTRAGGLLLQYLPQGEIGRERLFVKDGAPDWDHVRVLGETVRSEELADPALPLDGLLWRLFNEDEVRLLGEVPIRHGCKCSADYIAGVIGRFTDDERAAMREADGMITVDCAFCAKSFRVAA